MRSTDADEKVVSVERITEETGDNGEESNGAA